jgi:hypothetical protein
VVVDDGVFWSTLEPDGLVDPVVEPELVVCADATPRQSSSAAVIPNVRMIFLFLPQMGAKSRRGASFGLTV